MCGSWGTTSEEENLAGKPGFLVQSRARSSRKSKPRSTILNCKVLVGFVCEIMKPGKYDMYSEVHVCKTGNRTICKLESSVEYVPHAQFASVSICAANRATNLLTQSL